MSSGGLREPQALFVGSARLYASRNTDMPTRNPASVATRLALSALLLGTVLIGDPIHATPLTERQYCNANAPLVALVLDPRLEAAIRSSLDQFIFDLCIEGYSVIETVADFTTPPELRTYLSDLHGSGQGELVGAILIGDVPHAYQWVTIDFTNPNIPPLSEEVISFQYYADLDGVFAASPGYRSPGNHPFSYDLHEGAVDWEIWIGVLPLYRGSYARSREAINRYFEKNHRHRTGRAGLPRAFLQVTELLSAASVEEHDYLLDLLRSGTYAWLPFSSSSGARIYFDSPATGLSVQDGYADLSAGVADFVVLDAHGWWGASGALDIHWMETQPVRTSFLWSNGCSVGNLDHPENWLSSAIYSSTSTVVAAKGTTNDSGGMGTNEDGFFGRNVATVMSAGGNFGEAILSHVNVPLIWPWSDSREFHLATSVVLGDPTLKLLPYEGPSILYLDQGRFRIGALWSTPDNRSGAGFRKALTKDTGYFWFFNENNVEFVIKVLNACSINQRFWVFAGGLTNVETIIQVEDTYSGAIKRYRNPQGTAFLPIQDTAALATCSAGAEGHQSLEPVSSTPSLPQGGKSSPDRQGQMVAPEKPRDPLRRAAPSQSSASCIASPTALCLADERFRVELDWKTPQGDLGAGMAVRLTPDTGYFWFFDSSNVEVIVKVLNACTFNDHFWIFAGGLTNVRVEITVTDTLTGAVATYANPQDTAFLPIQDTQALDTCP